MLRLNHLPSSGDGCPPYFPIDPLYTLHLPSVYPSFLYFPTLLYTGAPPTSGWMPGGGKDRLQRDPTIQSAGRVGPNWGINRANGPFNIEHQFLQIMPPGGDGKNAVVCLKAGKILILMFKGKVVGSPLAKPSFGNKFSGKCYCEVIYRAF